MRLFSIIVSWSLWLLCSFYALAVLLIRTLDNLDLPSPSPEIARRVTVCAWIALTLFAIVAAGLLALRHRFWFQHAKSVGVGFLFLTVCFYLLVLMVTAIGFWPYFSGVRSIIQWASCAMGIFFLVVGFPRLPRAEASFPPDTFGGADKARTCNT